MKVDVLDFSTSKKVGDIDLSDSIYKQDIREDILAKMVIWQTAKRRQGTHSTRRVHQISGTTKKPYRQKGTGRARQGSLRSMQFKGGATYGPVPRDYEHKLTKKLRQLGLKTALSAKLKDNSILVIKSAELKSIKTKAAADAFAKLGVKSGLVINSGELNESFDKSTRNLKGINVLNIDGLNVYDILNFEKLILTEDSVKSINDKLAR